MSKGIDQFWIVQRMLDRDGYWSLNYWGPYCCKECAKYSKEYDKKTCHIVRLSRSFSQSGRKDEV